MKSKKLKKQNLIDNLHEAVKYGNYNRTRNLFKNTNNTVTKDVLDNWNQITDLVTPLSQAVGNYDPKLTELLLKNGVDPDQPCHCETDERPLHYLFNQVRQMNPEQKEIEKVLDILLQYNAEPNIKNDHGTPVLVCAIDIEEIKYTDQQKVTPIVRRLLKAGADPNYLNDQCKDGSKVEHSTAVVMLIIRSVYNNKDDFAHYGYKNLDDYEQTFKTLIQHGMSPPPKTFLTKKVKGEGDMTYFELCRQHKYFDESQRTATAI